MWSNEIPKSTVKTTHMIGEKLSPTTDDEHRIMNYTDSAKYRPGCWKNFCINKKYIELLQEVTNPNLRSISRYTAHITHGTEGRETDILTKEGLIISNIKRLLLGRGIAVVSMGHGS
jgi:hypothetical protein